TKYYLKINSTLEVLWVRLIYGVTVLNKLKNFHIAVFIRLSLTSFVRCQSRAIEEVHSTSRKDTQSYDTGASLGNKQLTFPILIETNFNSTSIYKSLKRNREIRSPQHNRQILYATSPPINSTLSGTEPIEPRTRESAYPAVNIFNSSIKEVDSSIEFSSVILITGIEVKHYRSILICQK
ncbi:hypothetical protein V1477_017871, partial [Vespula maculifrons]